MNKKPKWLLAFGLAAVITGSGIVMAATNNDTQFPAKKGDGCGKMPMHRFMKDGKGPMGHKMDNSALLELLKMDEKSFVQERKSGKKLVDIAAEHGVTKQQLKELYQAQMTQHMDAAIKEGRLTPEQAQKMRERMAARAEAFANGEHPKHLKMDNSALLALLKMDEQTLHQEMQSGKTLLAIGEERGITKQQLVDVHVKQMTERLENAVKEGRITAEKAAQMKQKMADRAEKFVSQPVNHGKHKAM